MELTKEQEKNLVHAVKAYRVAKKQYEAAQANMNMKLEKLKTACQGSGSEQQVLASAYEHLANAHMNMPEDDALEP